MVLDTNGTVIVNASVNLHSTHGTLQTTTDRDGKFRFVNLLPGTYRIEVKKDHFATNVIQPIHIKAEEVSLPSLTVTMRLAVMGKCGDLSTVSYEERQPDAPQLVGVMQPMPPKTEPNVSWPETPFSKATVEVFKIGSNQAVASTHPDDQGKFRFSGLALGGYTLKVSYAGYVDERSVKFEITKDVTDVTVPMIPQGQANVCM